MMIIELLHSMYQQQPEVKVLALSIQQENREEASEYLGIYQRDAIWRNRLWGWGWKIRLGLFAKYSVLVWVSSLRKRVKRSRISGRLLLTLKDLAPLEIQLSSVIIERWGVHEYQVISRIVPLLPEQLTRKDFIDALRNPSRLSFTIPDRSSSHILGSSSLCPYLS